MKRRVAVDQIVEVEVDETKFTEAWMAEWRQSFYNFHSIDQHLEHIAQLEARGILNRDFTEGYGPLADMGIKAKVIDQTMDILGDYQDVNMALHPIFADILAPWQLAPTARQLPQAFASPVQSNQSLSSGTPLATPKGMDKHRNWGRCWMVEYHGQNRATFECKAAGHQFKTALMPKAPNGKIPSEPMLQFMARHWSKQNESNTGGCNMRCPKCWPR
jgi:hypothetical protein